MKHLFTSPVLFRFDSDIGLLLLRVATGALLVSHGIPKLLNFSERAGVFADPIGLGSELSLAMAIFAEVFCSLAVMLGFMTRVATVPVIFTMLVITLIVHADDPWSKKEFALLYAVPFLTILLTGPGRFSLDHVLFFNKRI
jgi:putative oxidoreductase